MRVRLKANLWSWGLLGGWMSTTKTKVNLAQVGPIECSWNPREGATNPKPRPLFWLWGLSRVFMFEIGRAERLANAYGIRLSFDPARPLDRALIIQVWEYVIAFRWLPAHLSLTRRTMREQRQVEDTAALAERLGNILREHGIDVGPAAQGPLPDLRGNPNLN